MKRVVITGIGALSPIGNTFEECWENLLAGKNGVSVIERTGGVSIAGKLTGFNPRMYVDVKDELRLDPFAVYAFAAAKMAVEDAGASVEDFAVVIGTSRGGISRLNEAMKKLYGYNDASGRRKVSGFLMAGTTSGMAASYISRRFRTKGYCTGISTACASGASAVGEAFRLIKHGIAAGAIAGGAEAPVCEVCILGYDACRALSRSGSLTASCPFDERRNGFVLSEGSAVLVLEEYETALIRGAAVYAEVAGYGNSSDAFDMVKPSSRGPAGAMSDALKEAHLVPSDVGFINAHGTSTRLGDLAEAGAIKMLFGGLDVPVTANKSMTGHMLSSSGAFEIASTAMSLKEGIVPATINLTDVDPSCGINVVRSAIQDNFTSAISNSFGFGGVNVCVALKRLETSRSK
ncbi:MAG: beta-ketoacyl-[acyl-carrier-protein] synthase family protein, partial [Nitrospirae bacterium]|nr:beta-ketoacyl-[acyl-carrier-protein] synthase family protein [Nitrospirota bacterium]